MSDEITSFEPNVHRIEKFGPLDMVDVGQYWWVTFKRYNQEEVEELMVVTHVGSNHVCFKSREINRGHYSPRVHFEEFEETCRFEPNALVILQGEALALQDEIQKRMDAMLECGRSLCLIQSGKNEEGDQNVSALVPATKDPEEYKKDLIALRDDLPNMHKEIDELSSELAGTYKLMTEDKRAEVGRVYGALSVVEDRIFTVELYCGLLEKAHLIKDGEPAAREEKIAIRQQMLFMDEETLFDYNDGGMDFNDISKFDEWVVQPKNMERILPEKRGVVAFRVRRKPKEYGYELNPWVKIAWDKANMQTYLLIRNGEKVYRIAPEIDFSPRLVPLRSEFDGEKRFRQKHHRTVSLGPGDEGFNPMHKPGFPFNTRQEEYFENIGPDHLDYDRHVKKMEDSIKHYNRMIILLQGLLDRSVIFAPHPGIKLTDHVQIAKWVNLIRDEEDTLSDTPVDFGKWLSENNEGTKKGQWIYSNIGDPKDKGRGWNAKSRPRIVQVTAVRRDCSEVKVSWPWGTRYGYEHGDWGTWGEWPVDRMCHQWIPAGRFINLNHYQLGDYKAFLCDRELKGRYLEWGPFLLNAEDWKRQQIIEGKDVVEATKSHGRIPKKKKKIVVVEKTEQQDW